MVTHAEGEEHEDRRWNEPAVPFHVPRRRRRIGWGWRSCQFRD